MPLTYLIRRPEEKAELVRAWRASGVPLTRFAREHGVSKSALSSWAQRDRLSRALAFREVEVVDVAPPMPLVVTLAGSGHAVSVPPGFDAGELRRLVAALC